MTEKILAAIENQRWYFFANNDKILFDRDTALIWANPNHFPHAPNNYTIMKDFIAAKNSERWGGFDDWKIPTARNLWQMIKDKSFPFQSGDNRRINDLPFWYVIRPDDELRAVDFDGNAATRARKSQVHVLPCSAALVPKNFSSTPQQILNIFTRNNLVPKFDDATINGLYEKFSADTFAPTKLTATFDTAAIAQSPIKYFDAVLSLTDELLDILRRYETAQASTIAAYLQIALVLKSKFTDNPHLTPEENSLLADRQKFLARRLELATDEPKRKILSVKAQAENFFTRLEAVNAGNNSISELAALYAEPRVDFELLVENLSRIISDTQRRVDFFTEHKNFVAAMVKAHTVWSDAYKAFKTSLREELTAACRDESIDKEIFSAWYDDWRTRRFAIEQRFLPLIEFALKGKLSDVERVLEVLRGYRAAVDEFYLHERKNIYQKFAFQAGGDLQEKFEIEGELYKLTEKFQRDLQVIIFACDKSEERIFLLKWAEPLLNLPIDELSNFIRNRELDGISQEILTQFAELRRQNFAQYLSDAQAYGAALEQREKEFNALIFRMRKELNKS